MWRIPGCVPRPKLLIATAVLGLRKGFQSDTILKQFGRSFSFACRLEKTKIPSDWSDYFARFDLFGKSRSPAKTSAGFRQKSSIVGIWRFCRQQWISSATIINTQLTFFIKPDWGFTHQRGSKIVNSYFLTEIAKRVNYRFS